MDLADGHVAALTWVAGAGAGGVCETVNLGTGRPVSVKEMVTAYVAASGKPVPLVFGPRRPGDAASSFAVPAKAQRLLGWTAKRGLQEMCEDSWRWASTGAAKAALG